MERLLKHFSGRQNQKTLVVIGVLKVNTDVSSKAKCWSDASSCADPEHFVRGGSNLTFFVFFV